MRNPMNAGPRSIPDRSTAYRHPDLTPSWVVFGLAMGPAVAIGLARFAYALLLPPMRADLGWSFAQAGAMNTANAGGYLIGALAAAPLGGRMGDKTVFAVSLVFTALAVGASGLPADFTALSALRVAAGFTGALAFVCGAGLASAAATGGSRNRAPTLLGVYFAGAGMGVTASALAVPPLLERVGWRGGWLVLGALALAATAFGLWALRRAPEGSHAPAGADRRGWSPRFMACTLLAYGLFGAGYIAYATFIVAHLRSAEGFSGGDVTRFWSILGLSSVAAAFAWGRILGQLKGGGGTAATLSVLTIGTAAPLVWSTPAGAYLSAVLFGGSFHRPRRRDVVRASCRQAACGDGRDRHADRCVRHRPVHRPGAQRRAVRWAEWPQGRPVAVGRHLGGWRRRRGVSTRTGGAGMKLRDRRGILPAPRRRK
jgi:predicted MFS family arabinose efflux permease